MPKPIEDVSAEDQEPVVGESEEVKKDLAQINFPEVEGDTSPAAVIPKACASLQKYVSKLDGLLAQFTSAEQLTPLQTRNLGCLVFKQKHVHRGL